MRIDAHQHFWQIARADYGWLRPDLTPLYRDYLPADLQPHLERHQIRGTMLVQAAPTVAETEFLLHLAQQHAMIKGVIGWVDLTAGEASAQLHTLAQNPYFKGVRPMVQDIPQDDWLVRAPIDHAIHTLMETDLIFEALVKPRHLPYLVEFLARYPSLKVTLNHAAKPAPATDFATWQAAIQQIAQHPQIVCKLSGMVTEFPVGVSAAQLQPWVEVLLEAFGPARLMWGSDWPVLTLVQSYDEWWAMSATLLQGLAPTDLAQIQGGTACSWYQLA